MLTTIIAVCIGVVVVAIALVIWALMRFKASVDRDPGA
jgi:hypothetical protein